jgi:hypothetical protein
VFESRERLAEDILHLVDAVRQEAGGRYACLMEPGRILFESPEPEDQDGWTLRRLLEERSAALFSLPLSMADEGPSEDLFEGWEKDDFLLAFVNGRVALAVACPDAEAVRHHASAARARRSPVPLQRDLAPRRKGPRLLPGQRPARRGRRRPDLTPECGALRCAWEVIERHAPSESARDG